MPITTDAELRHAVDRINSDLQDVQNYLGQNNHQDAKIRFPSGFIRPAIGFRAEVSYLIDRDLIRNIAYAHITTDVYRWLLNRTSIVGTAKEMIIKEGICLAAAIVESLTMAAGLQLGLTGKHGKFKKRCKRFVEEGLITETLYDELMWLWETRQNEHLFLVEATEYQVYGIRDYNRAGSTLRELKRQLKEYFDNLDVPF